MTQQPRAMIFGFIILLVAGLLTYRFIGAISASAQVTQRVCLELEPEPLSGPATNFELPALDGKKLKLSSLKGKPVLLHFWFTDCPPCVEELPSLVALQQQAKRAGYEIVTVSVDESAEKLRAFVAQYQLQPLTILHDPTKSVSQRYGTEKFPESYLIDKGGQLRYRFVNQRNWATSLAGACINSI